MKILLIALSIILTFFSVFADDKRNLLFVCDEWVNYTNSDGTGAYWDIVKAVYEPLGITVKTVTMPWKRALYTVRNNDADGLVGGYYEAGNTAFLYPNWHISVEDPVIALSRKGTIENWDREGVRALEGKRVIWIRGYDFDRNISELSPKRRLTLLTYCASNRFYVLKVDLNCTYMTENIPQ